MPLNSKGEVIRRASRPSGSLLFVAPSRRWVTPAKMPGGICEIHIKRLPRHRNYRRHRAVPRLARERGGLRGPTRLHDTRGPTSTRRNRCRRNQHRRGRHPVLSRPTRQVARQSGGPPNRPRTFCRHASDQPVAKEPTQRSSIPIQTGWDRPFSAENYQPGWTDTANKELMRGQSAFSLDKQVGPGGITRPANRINSSEQAMPTDHRRLQTMRRISRPTMPCMCSASPSRNATHRARTLGRADSRPHGPGGARS